MKNKHFPVRQRLFLRKINLENGGGCGIMKYRKEGPVYGRIPYELRFLMILQAVKRILNIRFGVKAGKAREKKKMQKNEKSS